MRPCKLDLSRVPANRYTQGCRLPAYRDLRSQLLLGLGALPQHRLVRFMAKSSVFDHWFAGRFMRAMAEAAKIMHTDKQQTFKVLQKYLRIDDRKLLEASYNVEIKALEPRLALKLEGIQSTLDEIAPTELRAKSVKPQDMVDMRYLDEMEKSGFFEQLWAGKK